MALLDLFRRPQRTDPVFGTLTYRRHAWCGAVEIPEYSSSPIPMEISSAKNCDLSPFRDLFARHVEYSAKLRAVIAEAAYETYATYVREDLATGNFVEEDYAEYTKVKSPVDIWCALSPFGFALTLGEQGYDSVVSLDVRWPNPHYFQAYCKNDDLYLLDVDG